MEVDGENIQHWSIGEVIQRARLSSKVPPSLLVMSLVRTFEIPRSGSLGGFGITLRGDSPVYIRSVDFDSNARSVGVRSGDLLLAVNGHDVRYSSKLEALELLKETRHVLQLKVVTGGIHSHQMNTSNAEEEKERKATMFHNKVNTHTRRERKRQTDRHTYTHFFDLKYNMTHRRLDA